MYPVCKNNEAIEGTIQKQSQFWIVHLIAPVFCSHNGSIFFSRKSMCGIFNVIFNTYFFFWKIMIWSRREGWSPFDPNGNPPDQDQWSWSVWFDICEGSRLQSSSRCLNLFCNDSVAIAILWSMISWFLPGSKLAWPPSFKKACQWYH